jgi:hypothetical protein
VQIIIYEITIKKPRSEWFYFLGEDANINNNTEFLFEKMKNHVENDREISARLRLNEEERHFD